MIGFSCHLLEQTNRGRLTLQTSDPADLPVSIRACWSTRKIFARWFRP